MKTTTNRIDFGAVGWRLADVPITFGSKERAIDYATEQAGRKPPYSTPDQQNAAALASVTADPQYVDTRPTIRDVAKQLSEAENDACDISVNSRRYGTVGPWDEYFRVLNWDPPGEKWPHDFRWIAVFVVVGGSEGLYLHVEAIDCEGARRLLLLGKTCAGGREAWSRCYESAARISWLLNT